MRKLDIIVTHYREPWKVGEQFFRMLESQRGIDFDDIRVVLVQDGPDGALPLWCPDGYPFQIKRVTIPHGGVSAARNAGLDASYSEWVMFCDFDDAFYTSYSVAHFLREMRVGKNIIVSKLYWEVYNRQGKVCLCGFDGTDCVFVHGKAFRRQWLLDNNLRFDNELTLHEDSYFVTLAELMVGDGELAKIDEPMYLWQHYGNSVTKSYRNFTLETFSHWVKKTRHLINELARRCMYGGIRIVLCDSVVDTYSNFNSVDWSDPALAEEYRKALSEYDDLLAEYWESIEQLPKQMLDNRIEIRCTKENGLLPSAHTYYEWMKERKQSIWE